MDCVWGWGWGGWCICFIFCVFIWWFGDIFLDGFVFILSFVFESKFWRRCIKFGLIMYFFLLMIVGISLDFVLIFDCCVVFVGFVLLLIDGCLLKRVVGFWCLLIFVCNVGVCIFLFFFGIKWLLGCVFGKEFDIMFCLRFILSFCCWEVGKICLFFVGLMFFILICCWLLGSICLMLDDFVFIFFGDGGWLFGNLWRIFVVIILFGFCIVIGCVLGKFCCKVLDSEVCKDEVWVCYIFFVLGKLCIILGDVM